MKSRIYNKKRKFYTKEGKELPTLYRIILDKTLEDNLKEVKRVLRFNSSVEDILKTFDLNHSELPKGNYKLQTKIIPQFKKIMPVYRGDPKKRIPMGHLEIKSGLEKRLGDYGNLTGKFVLIKGNNKEEFDFVYSLQGTEYNLTYYTPEQQIQIKDACFKAGIDKYSAALYVPTCPEIFISKR